MVTAAVKSEDDCLLAGNYDKPRQCVEKQRLLTKVHIVKVVVFPVVTYSCESWTLKKADLKELMPLNCGIGEDS